MNETGHEIKAMKGRMWSVWEYAEKLDNSCVKCKLCSQIIYTEGGNTSGFFLFSSFEYPWPRQLKLPKPVSLKGSHKGHYPRKSLSWTVSIPLGEHRNIDLFSQSVLEQTHEGQAQ